VMRARVGAVLFLLLVGCGAGENESTERDGGATDPAGTQAVEQPKPYVEMTVRRPPEKISGDDVLVRGTVTPADATVTVRGEPAAVKDGKYRLRLKMRVGTNRFTVVARHPDYRTNSRRLRVDREPVPAPGSPPSSACPPGQVPQTQMGTGYCRTPGPTACPPGQVPAGEEACAPAESQDEGLEPCVYGEAALCTPEENQAERDAEARCGPLDPTRFDENGNYVPLPGC